MVKTRIEQIRQARQIHGGTFNMWTAALGVKLSRIPIPSQRLRERVYRTVYGSKYRALNEAELDRPLNQFRSVNELFTRGVRPECRPVSMDGRQLLCPCDGTVQDLGRLQRDRLLTVKGIEYSLTSLLPQVETRQFEDGQFAIIFLSPADCHRVFAPAEGWIRELIHVPGRRLLVHPPFQTAEYPVFSLNERVIIRLETPFGQVLLVMVAGWGVGNITFPFESRLRTRRRRVTSETFTSAVPLSRAAWLATFELGSTVILITERDSGLTPFIERHQTVQYGQPAFQSERVSA